MLNKPSNAFPYTAPVWLGKIVEELRRSLPSQVDVAWLTQRLGLSEPNARQLLGVLQRVGWLDEGGMVTERAKGLRQLGEPYQGHVEEMVRDLYPALLPLVEQDDTFDLRRLREYVTNQTELGESARQQIARTFRWFVHEAGMTSVEHRIWGGRRARERPGTEAGAPRPPGSSARTVDQTGGTTPRRQPRRQTRERPPSGEARVSLVVNINIPADATPEQIQLILAQLTALFPGGAAHE